MGFRGTGAAGRVRLKAWRAVQVQWAELCQRTLHKEDLEKFQRAVDEEYYFEMLLDGLPMWGYVGEVEENDFLLGQSSIVHHYLFTHLHFSVGFNDDRVVEVNVSTAPMERVEITDMERVDVAFSYSVSWSEVQTRAEDRMERYSHHSFMSGAFEIHWLSIVNSFVLVVMLTAFLSLILIRVLRNDLAQLVDDEGGVEEETGWKQLHGDVFRPPAHASLLAAAVGAGAHLLCVVAAVLAIALTGAFRVPHRGTMLSSVILLYTLLAPVGGRVSAQLYKQLGGTNWVWNVVTSALAFPGPLVAAFLFLNTTAFAHGSTAALPFGTILVVAALFVLVALPLHVLGGILGHNASGDLRAPCRVKKVARQIPDAPWYRAAPVQFIIAGCIPFSAIYIELNYIFAAVWGHRVYTLFGILALAFTMLLIVASFITIALTYFQLAAEDHRWWWRSFLSGASAGAVVYAYCFVYYFLRSEMRGFMQTSFFFGYMAIASYGFALMLGAVAFYSSLAFVRRIYSSIKTE